jgi:hypothetical protein
LLDYPSSAVKDGSNRQPVEDIAKLLKATRPQVVYTHNLADKHDTHIGVTLTDITTGLVFAMDLTPLIEDPDKNVQVYIQTFVDKFAQDVRKRIERIYN